jgi:ribosomal protein S18 acetylase RimI-like enzyme
MPLIKSKGLSPTQFSQIRQLEAICNDFDGLTMKLNLETLRQRKQNEINDFLMVEGEQLIGYLALFIFTKAEVEVSAMIHPAYRRRGLFKQLLAAAQAEVARRAIPHFLFICERGSVMAVPVMQALAARYDFSEYKMTLQPPVRSANLVPELVLRQVGPAELDLLAHMDVTCFNVSFEAARQYIGSKLDDPHRRVWVAEIKGNIIGKIHVSVVENESYINAFCILPPYRGRGCGKTILSRTVERLVAEQHEIISLEVETENENALGLYKTIGFEVVTAYDYYRLPV